MTFTSGLRCKVFSMSGLILLLPGAPVAAPHQATAPQDASPAAQSFRISGTAVNAMTGAPLSQARISIAEIVDRGKITSMITSEDGHFVFSQRKAGKYSLQGAKRGFMSAAYDQHEQFSTAIVTGPEFSTENLVLRLTPMAFITGHAFDEFGDPIRHAQVILFFENHAAGMSRITRLYSSTSDGRCFYDFSLLRPGKYYVSVTSKPWSALHPSRPPNTAANPAQQISPALDCAYPATYYNGATEADRSPPIEVKGGARLQIDMPLNPRPALHLAIRFPAARPAQA